MKFDSRGPIRIGLAGLGRAGVGMHIPELASLTHLFKIVAVCDPIKDRRIRVADELGCVAYRTYEDMLQDSEVELVDIATRSVDHFEHALMALKTKRYVFLEKPMTINFDEARKLRAAALKAKNRLYIRHNRRFEPGFQKALEVISSGVLGKVYDIKLRRGVFQRRDDWQTVKRCGGGQLLNWGPHIIDHALQFLGTPPTHIYTNLQRVVAVGDAEDYVRIIMKNAAGLSVDLEISGGRIIDAPECVVTGNRGALSLSGDKMYLRYLDQSKPLPRRRATVRTPKTEGFGTAEKLPWIEETIDIGPTETASEQAIWQHLYDSIRRNKAFPISIDQAVEVMRIVATAVSDSPFV